MLFNKSFQWVALGTAFLFGLFGLLFFQHKQEISNRNASHQNLTPSSSAYLASVFLAEHDIENYDLIASQWKDQGNLETWHLLEADAYAMKGEPEKAIALLDSLSFDGENEVSRLVRLALLNQNEHPKVSWNYLSQALKLYPERADLHSHRAKWLQSTQFLPLALHEFKTAVLKDPKNSFYKEDLVSFYFDSYDWKSAASFLQSSLDTSSSAKLWIQALFLNKVFQPLKYDFASNSPHYDKLTPLVHYLLAMPMHEFWNDSLVSSQKKIEVLSNHLPEVNWLKTLEALKTRSDGLALEILNQHPEMMELNPPLYLALKKAILEHHPYLKGDELINHQKSLVNVHPIFSILFQSEMPKQYASLAKSKDLYGALILASGWYEAALTLNEWYPNKAINYPEISSELPRWIAYGYAKALVANRSKVEALKFIQKQTLTPQLSLLAGELYFDLKEYVQAERILETIAPLSGTIGTKASYLLSQVYAEQKNFLQARKAILDKPELTNSITGKEMLARLELTFGDPYLAESMYQQIQDSSFEAKSFLAKRAFKKKDYLTAYTLTKDLLEKHPNNRYLKKQLQHIRSIQASN